MECKVAFSNHIMMKRDTHMKLKRFAKSIISLSQRREMIPIIHPVNIDKIFIGKTAIITGGTGGVGQAIVETLYENGCNIVACGTNAEKLKDLKAKYDETRFSVLEYNYSAPDQFSEKIESAAKLFGGLDILICSAGVHTENVDFWNITHQEYDRVLGINLKGTYFTCLEFAKYMRANKRSGHILLISSSRGSEPAWSPYGVSKWGMKGMTEGFAKMLLPYGITVNAVAPGPTATSLIGFKDGDSIFSFENNANRLITPDEVANLAMYMVSDMGTMITGETIHISAGRGTIDIR